MAKKKKIEEEEPSSSKTVIDEPPKKKQRAQAKKSDKTKKSEGPNKDAKKKKSESPSKDDKKKESGKENEDVNPREKESTTPFTLNKEYTKGNIVQYYEELQKGRYATQLRHCVVYSVMSHIKALKWYKGESCFDNRITFLEWHPTNPFVVAVASKNGDIILWHYEENIASSKKIKGNGAGCSIQAMKFHPHEPDSIYTVSITGKFLKDNFETNMKDVILDTKDWKRWYCSCDINFDGKIMVAGDNNGYLTLMTSDKEIIHKVKACKSNTKITNCEFSKTAPWLLVTSTGQRTVKLWDIRKLDEEHKPLQELEQKRAINAAYFSLTDGARLLTTDQYDRITVYRGPVWFEETVIQHPHRQFQHLTPIRACWHPLEDIIVCGRYPNPRTILVESDSVSEAGIRTVDFLDATTGKLKHQLHHPGFNHIVSLNKFNHIGDTLASGAGRHIVIWKPNFKDQERSDEKFFSHGNKKDSDDDDDDDEDKPLKDKKLNINKTNLFGRESTRKETKKINVTWLKEDK